MLVEYVPHSVLNNNCVEQLLFTDYGILSTLLL